MMGRPSKRTADVERVILDAIEAGASNSAAYRSAGVPRQTWHDWMRDSVFSDAVAQARARAVSRAESLVFGQNALTWLQRGPGRKFLAVDDEQWPTTASVEITGKDGGPVAFDVSTARERLLDGVDRLAPGSDDTDAA